MVITETDARTKWCPFARDVTGENDAALASFNRPFGPAYPAFDTCACIGSQCMAWRELHPRMEREDHGTGPSVITASAAETGRTVRREGGLGSLGRLILDAVGYCGLAGKP